MEPVRVTAKRVPYLRLNVTASHALEMAAQMQEKGATKQAILLDFLARQNDALPDGAVVEILVLVERVK